MFAGRRLLDAHDGRPKMSADSGCLYEERIMNTRRTSRWLAYAALLVTLSCGTTPAGPANDGADWDALRDRIEALEGSAASAIDDIQSLHNTLDGYGSQLAAQDERLAELEQMSATIAALQQQVAELAASSGAPAAYGNGASGSLTITQDVRLGDRVTSSTVLPGQNVRNLQFTDFTVAEGVTLTVQSGTVIRCTGTFTNNGTIIVQHGAEGSDRLVAGSTGNPVLRSAPAGVATLAAASGDVGSAATLRAGGTPGAGLSEFEAVATIAVGVNAGGGGGAALDAGGDGGGGFVVIAQGELTNTGTIQATGADAPAGGGGGGGGVVILASRTAVTNTSSGFIDVSGGDGGDANSSSGPGGGGGGGIVHLIAPELSDEGTMVAAGGAAGASGSHGGVTASTRSGGGGGGASGGSGGTGGSVEINGDTTAAEGGQAGFTLMTQADPSALF
jgi:hypothetical protein